MRKITITQRKTGWLATIGDNRNVSLTDNALYGFLIRSVDEGYEVKFV